jgi:hypothetical protein
MRRAVTPQPAARARGTVIANSTRRLARDNQAAERREAGGEVRAPGPGRRAADRPEEEPLPGGWVPARVRPRAGGSDRRPVRGGLRPRRHARRRGPAGGKTSAGRVHAVAYRDEGGEEVKLLLVSP